MKLKNKKTGEIATLIKRLADKDELEVLGESTHLYNTLAELCEDWEDAPKEYYYICCDGEVRSDADDLYAEDCKLIGNYFSTKAEVELAVEKLKSWKRLKDKGFEFSCPPQCGGLCGNGFEIHIEAIMPPKYWTIENVKKDLNLLFSGDEK